METFEKTTGHYGRKNYNGTFSFVDEGLHLLLKNRIFCILGKVTFRKHKNMIGNQLSLFLHIQV